MNENEETQAPAPTPATPPPLNPAIHLPLPENPGIRELFEALLRRPTELARHKVCEDRATLFRFGLIAVISILVFGFVLGTFAYGNQLWAAPLKLGGGLLFAGLICFPSLYIFSSLAGSTASAARMGGLLGGTLALAGLLLLGFAPALWIFAQGTASFGFMGFLAITSWLVALAFAYRFLRAALRETGATQSAPIIIWVSIFLLVSLQLSTSLRPILGRSDDFMTSEKKFFLEHWGDMIGESLGHEKDRGGESRDTTRAETWRRTESLHTVIMSDEKIVGGGAWLGFWAIHCSVSFLPGLLIAGKFLDFAERPVAMVAMFAALATFIPLIAALTYRIKVLRFEKLSYRGGCDLVYLCERLMVVSECDRDPRRRRRVGDESDDASPRYVGGDRALVFPWVGFSNRTESICSVHQIQMLTMR